MIPKNTVGSKAAWKTVAVLILIRWLCQKPADLDLHQRPADKPVILLPVHLHLMRIILSLGCKILISASPRMQ